MPLTNPRIIVVDAKQNLHHIVRAAMELMGRRPRLIETYTGDDAITELKISSPDLLITAHALVGTTNGPMLAIIAKRELAALPVLVIANEDDPELDEDTRSQSPFVYLRRPFAPELFLRELRVALDGPEAGTKESRPEEIISVPNIDEEQIKPIMQRLIRDVGAMAAVLADRNAKVLTYVGAAGYFDRDLLAEALAPGFGSITKLLSIVGDQPRVLKFFDGERAVVFGLALGLHHYLYLVFEGAAPPSALGNVKRYGYAAVNDILKIVGPVAFDPKPAIAAPPPAPAEMPRRRRVTQEMPAIQQPPTPMPTPVRPAPRAPEPERIERPAHSRRHKDRPPENTSTDSMDLSLFDQLDQVDMSQADELLDFEKLSNEGLSASGDAISFDDALLQGIIGDIEE